MSDDVRFNKFKKRLISLCSGEKFCRKCNGEGVVSNRSKNFRPLPITAAKYLTCSKCFGDGKLDWVEQVTGKALSTMEGKNGTYTS